MITRILLTQVFISIFIFYIEREGGRDFLRDTTYLSSAALRQKRRRKMSPDGFIFNSRLRILLYWGRSRKPRCIQGSSFIQTVFFFLINKVNRDCVDTFLSFKCYSSGNGNFFNFVYLQLFEPPRQIGVTNDLLMRAKTLFCLSNINIIQQYSWNTDILNISHTEILIPGE